MGEPSDRSDEALIDATRRGDAGAFEELYYRHRDWVAAQAYRVCGNRDDALDVLQETFAYLARKLPTLILRARLRTFLYPAVKHLALGRVRARRRLAATDALPDPPDPAAERSERRAEGEEEIRRLLARLPEGEADVLWLRFVDGFSLAEVAEALGIPLGTVKSRLHAALNALRAGGGPRP